MRVIESIVNSGHGSLNPTYLFVHETANPGASALNHKNLYASGWDYAVHYVLDWTGDVYHCMYDNRLAWAVGNGNPYGVSVEICHATNTAQFNKTWDTAVAFCAWYLKKRGWGIDRMMSHDECRRKWGGTDHTDPTGYFAQYGKTFADFKNAVAKAMGGTITPSTGGSSSGGSSSAPSGSVPDLRYRVSVDPKGKSWYAEMKNHTDTGGSGDTFAGDLKSPIRWLAINMPGSYQVKTANGWLPKVYKYNIGDLNNGCAGDGTPITAIRCYYETPDPKKTGYFAIEYQAYTGVWLPAMRDLTDTGGSRDDFAGNGKQITGFRARLVRV